LIAFGPPALVFTTQRLAEAIGGQVLMLPEGVAVVDHCCPDDEPETHAVAPSAGLLPTAPAAGLRAEREAR
jgi:hypothetical protein